MTKKFELTKVDKKAIKNVVESLRPTPVFLHTVSDKQFKSIGDVNEVISQLADEAYRKDVVEFSTKNNDMFVQNSTTSFLYASSANWDITSLTSQLADEAYRKDVVEFCTNISLFFVEKYGEDRKEEILEEISTVAEKAMNSD